MGYKNHFLEPNFLGGFGGPPLEFPYVWGCFTVLLESNISQSHIYDLSTNNPCSLRANLMVSVGCSQKTKYLPSKTLKIPLFNPLLVCVKNPKFFYDGHKLGVGSCDLTPKLAVFSVWRVEWVGNIGTDKKGAPHAIGTQIFLWVLLLGSFCLSSMVWIRSYGGKTF